MIFVLGSILFHINTSVFYKFHHRFIEKSAFQILNRYRSIFGVRLYYISVIYNDDNNLSSMRCIDYRNIIPIV